MTARAYALMTGLFVIFLIGLIGAAAYWFGGVHPARRSYVVVAHRSIMGLRAQSTVYYRGVPVGTVTSIDLAPQDVSRTLVDISIDPSIPVTAGTYARLVTQGVTGIATLELNDSGESPARLPSSENSPAHIPLRSGGFSDLTSAARTLIGKLDTVADALHRILGPENQARIGDILATTQQLTQHLDELERRLDTSLAGLPALTQNARSTLKRIDTLTGHLIRLTDSLHQTSERLGSFAATGKTAGAELAQQTLPKLGTTLDDLQRTAKAIEGLSRSLERNPQQLLFGPKGTQPGPGEPGYQPPR